MLGEAHQAAQRPAAAQTDDSAAIYGADRELYPSYAEADLVVETSDTPHHIAVKAILKALAERAETAR